MATVEDRVAQLERDVQELRQSATPAGLAFGLSLVRDEVAELRRETRAGFAAVDVRFDAVTSRLDGIDARFGDVNSRLDTIAAGVAQILERLGGEGQPAA